MDSLKTASARYELDMLKRFLKLVPMFKPVIPKIDSVIATLPFDDSILFELALCKEVSPLVRRFYPAVSDFFADEYRRRLDFLSES